MKALSFLVSLGLSPLVMTSCTSAPRIDGSSPAAFERTHAAVLASLSPEDRMRLVLAQLIVLSDKDCLTTKPIPGQPFLNDTLGGQADLSSCRGELHGLSFEDIMKQAYPSGETPGGSAWLPPNNSFKPNLLRKSA